MHSSGLTQHGVKIVDTPVRRVHHPADLMNFILCCLGIGLILLIANYAQGTAEGVSEDVHEAGNALRGFLAIPRAVFETLLTTILPLLVLLELAVRRLGRQILETMVATGLAIAAIWATSMLIYEFSSYSVIAGLSVYRGGETVLALPSYFALTAGLLTGAGTRTRRSSVKIAWNVQWFSLIFVVLTDQVTLLGGLLALLVGRSAGLLVRYISGVTSERAYGERLVDGIRKAGFDPEIILRSNTLIDTSSQTSVAWSDITGNRIYKVETRTGEVLDVVVLDGDRQVLGLFSRLWQSWRLKTIDSRTVVSLRQATERAALLSYAAKAAGVNTQQLLAISDAADSMLLIYTHVPNAKPLSSVPASQVTSEILDQLWHELRRAHEAGIAHRWIKGDSILVTGIGGTSPQLWLSGWERGDVASSRLARRTDLAQTASMLALHLGIERTLESMTANLSTQQIAEIVPLLQVVAVPGGNRDGVRAHSRLLKQLRNKLIARLPQTEIVEPERIVRFGFRSVLLASVTVVAIFVVFTTFNFSEVLVAIRSASPLWMGVAFALGMVQFIAAAMALIGFSPVKLPWMRTIIAQTAAAFVSLAAPAGVGASIINLRMLTKRQVPRVLAVATVALVQVSMVVFTVIILGIITIVSGRSGALAQLPSGSILLVLGLLALAIASMLLIPRVRSLVVAKVMPTVRNTWPRFIEVIGQPGKLALGITGNMLVTLTFLFAFMASLKAFGQHVPFIDLAIVFLLSIAIGSLAPTPGGLGTIELALITGLTSVGVAPGISASVVVLYRSLTYWGRLPFGWMAMKYLQRVGEF